MAEDVMPENGLSEGMERLLKALDRTGEPGLSGTLEALGEALGLSFAALIGRPRQRAAGPEVRLLAHWGLSPAWASTLAQQGAEFLRPAPIRFTVRELRFPLPSEPPCRCLAALPLPGLQGTWLLVASPDPSRLGPEETVLLGLVGRLLEERARKGALHREKSRLEESLGTMILAGTSREALIDGAGRVVAASPPLEALLGRKEGELIGALVDRLLLESPEQTEGGRRSRAQVRSLARRGHGQALLQVRGGGSIPVRLGISRLSAGRWHARVFPLAETESDLDLSGAGLWSLGVWTAGLAREWTQLMAGALGGASIARRELPAGHSAVQALDLLEERLWRAAHLAQHALELALPDAMEAPLDPVTQAHEAALLANLSLADGVRVRVSGVLEPMHGSAAALRLLLHTALLCVAGTYLEGPIEVILGPSAGAKADLRWTPAPPLGRGLLLQVNRTGLAMEDPEPQLPERCNLTCARKRGPELLARLIQLARGMGGAVSVASDPEDRKRIQVFLPARTLPASHPVALEPRLEALHSEALLLVEGEQAVLEAGRDSLEEEGYQVLTAADGLQAVAAFQHRHEEIALVIIDLSLPRLGGVETLRQMRKTNSGLKALVTSSYGEAITRQALEGLGVEGYLRKPYGQSGLIRKVAECLAL